MALKGEKQSREHVAARLGFGPDNHSWKGNAVSANGARGRARRLYEQLPCSNCGGSKAERHHVDGNPKNNAPSNIRFLCHRCHMAEHNVSGEISERGRQYVERAIAASIAARLGKVVCKNGHPLEGENLYVNPRGERSCKICNREHRRRYEQRVKSGRELPA